MEFKIGQRIEIIDKQNPNLIGVCGTITRLEEDRVWAIWDDNPSVGEKCWFINEDIESEIKILDKPEWDA